MATSTFEDATTTEKDTFTIGGNANDGYYIVRNGVTLVNRYGYTRVFATRNSARKRIQRERTGNFHS